MSAGAGTGGADSATLTAALASTEKYLPRLLASLASKQVLEGAELPSPAGWHFGPRIVGKVRDIFVDEGRGVVVLVATDRQSAFDRLLTAVPHKGAVLNLVSQWWFEHTRHIIDNAVLGCPQARVTVARKCSVFPVEFVMRGYITGSTSTSLWTNYAKGVRQYCGHQLPDGLLKNQKLAANLLTPTTKGEHDELISAEEIVASGRMSQADWDVCAAAAHALFAFGQQEAAKRGLILVDTKYEFGKTADGQILLIDEIHTPDSSRWWVADAYDACMAAGLAPQNVDKEFLRLWYKERCDPYTDSVLPTPPPELVAELARRYIMLYEMITGQRFVFPDEGADPQAGIVAAVHQWCAQQEKQ